jgi:hypothetical protein
MHYTSGWCIVNVQGHWRFKFVFLWASVPSRFKRQFITALYLVHVGSACATNEATRALTFDYYVWWASVPSQLYDKLHLVHKQGVSYRKCSLQNVFLIQNMFSIECVLYTFNTTSKTSCSSKVSQLWLKIVNALGRWLSRMSGKPQILKRQFIVAVYTVYMC